MLVRLDENSNITDVFKETLETTETELVNAYLRREIEWRLTESLNPEECFDEDYGQSLNLVPAYVKRFMMEYGLADFVDWDKLDNKIEDIVKEVNNEVRKDLSR